MPRTMTIVKTIRPKILSGKSVESEAADTFWELDFLQRNVALENQGVGLTLHVRWLAKVESSCGISGSVQKLSSRIAKIDGFGVDY